MKSCSRKILVLNFEGCPKVFSYFITTPSPHLHLHVKGWEGRMTNLMVFMFLSVSLYELQVGLINELSTLSNLS